MDNERIGRIDGETITWPEVDILGQSYSRPPGMTVGIGDGRFVVVPVGMPKAQLNALLAEFAMPVKNNAGKGRRDEAEATS
jgi:hypothetical protein